MSFRRVALVMLGAILLIGLGVVGFSSAHGESPEAAFRVDRVVGPAGRPLLIYIGDSVAQRGLSATSLLRAASVRKTDHRRAGSKRFLQGSSAARRRRVIARRRRFCLRRACLARRR